MKVVNSRREKKKKQEAEVNVGAVTWAITGVPTMQMICPSEE